MESVEKKKLEAVKRQKLCGIVFLMKSTLAFALGIVGLWLNGNRVIQLHAAAAEVISRRSLPVAINAALCGHSTNDLARLEPPKNTVMFGFHYDWIQDNPVVTSDKLGFYPAVSNAYLDMYSDRTPSFNTSLFDWHAEEVQRIGGILAMTMQPNDINRISDAMIEELVESCYRANTLHGTGVFLRFGHEMNGDWPTYGMRPTAFIAAFRRVATAVYARTNMTAMVFGPNAGISYPYLNTPGALSTVPSPTNRPDDFAALDTNRNGAIDAGDDPYLPYYPGDDYVDWVALSIYWYPDATTGYNRVPPETYFQDMITSTGPSMAIVDESKNGDPLRNFYQRMSVERNKPMMIPETSAPYTPNITTGATGAQIKTGWWKQMLSLNNTQNNFPRLKLIVQFEEQKLDGNLMFQDWRVLADPATKSAWLDVISQERSRMTFANEFKVSCQGMVVNR